MEELSRHQSDWIMKGMDLVTTSLSADLPQRAAWYPYDSCDDDTIVRQERSQEFIDRRKLLSIFIR